MFQGFYVLVSYALITFILSQIIEKEHQVKIIIGAFVFLGIMIGLLGFYQYIGKDLIQTDFGLKLIRPKALEEIDLGFIFGKYDIYATMGNTNFVGSYAALMIPLSHFHSIYIRKKLIYQVFSIIFFRIDAFGCLRVKFKSWNDWYCCKFDTNNYFVSSYVY